MNNLGKLFKKYLRLFLTGFGMGTADLIPGVSGGTIAFLSGIYEQLIESIKLISGDVVRLLLRGKFISAFKLIPFNFLLPLVLGLFTAIFALSKALSYLLLAYPVFIWSFFFGLVLYSVLIVLKRIKKWQKSNFLAFIISTIGGYVLVGMVPGVTPVGLLYFFLSGMIAIIAMILPGISGSFILLLLGKYQQVLAAVNERDFLTLFVFGLGAVIGLALFSRVLSWLFKNYHDMSISILAGFMLGSIRKIWPWQEVVTTRVNSHGEITPIIVQNVLPSSVDLEFIIAILLIIIGGFIIYKLDKMQKISES